MTTNTYGVLNRVLTANTVNSKDSSKNVSKSYTYDSMGRITKTVSNGLITNTIYDDLGRKYTETASDGNDYAAFRSYFYESVSQYTKEQIVGINNLLMYSYTSYEYDGEMRLIKVKETGEETVSYTYEPMSIKWTINAESLRNPKSVSRN